MGGRGNEVMNETQGFTNSCTHKDKERNRESVVISVSNMVSYRCKGLRLE